MSVEDVAVAMRENGAKGRIDKGFIDESVNLFESISDIDGRSIQRQVGHFIEFKIDFVWGK